MPQNKFALARYRLIDHLLRINDYVKTAAIADYCQDKIGYHISQRTIQLDILAMKYDELLGYFAPIEYDNHRKAHYYSDPTYILTPFSLTAENRRVLQHILTLCSDYIPLSDQKELQLIIRKLDFLIG